MVEKPDTPAPASLAADRPMDAQKILRLASLAREVLEEVRRMSPQSSTAKELAALYRRVEGQLKEALPENLVKELEEIELDLPFRGEASGEEIRVVYSALIGWLGGLFQGLHASMLMQQQTGMLPVPADMELPPGGPNMPNPGALGPGAGKPEGYL